MYESIKKQQALFDTPSDLSGFYLERERLTKKTKRYGTRLPWHQERLDQHNKEMLNIAVFIFTEFPEFAKTIDTKHVLAMIPEHDLGEIKLKYDISANFNQEHRIKYIEEYDEAKTREAKFVKYLDKMQSIVFMLRNGLKFYPPYDIILTNKMDYVHMFDKELSSFHNPIFNQVKEQIQQLQNPDTLKEKTQIFLIEKHDKLMQKIIFSRHPMKSVIKPKNLELHKQ